MHGLEELESKLSAYHVMVEKEVLHKRDGRGSLSPIDQAPPPPLEKPKWKMSMSAVKDTYVCPQHASSRVTSDAGDSRTRETRVI